MNEARARTITIRQAPGGLAYVTSEDEPPIFIAQPTLVAAVEALARALRGEE